MGLNDEITGQFWWATGIEDTFVPQVRPGMRALDEYELTQHYRWWREDIDRAAALGIQALRWGIPWYKVQPTATSWDWRWVDEVLDYMVNGKGITPIIDLMHYGTPLWLDNSFINSGYPALAVRLYVGAGWINRLALSMPCVPKEYRLLAILGSRSSACLTGTTAANVDLFRTI